MKALFGRKVSNLAELKEITEEATKQGQRGQSRNAILYMYSNA